MFKEEYSRPRGKQAGRQGVQRELMMSREEKGDHMQLCPQNPEEPPSDAGKV